MLILLALLYAVLGVTSVQALGINCLGNGSCKNEWKDQAQKLQGYLDTIADDTFYQDGKRIACTLIPHEVNPTKPFPICAYLQKSQGANGKRLKELAQFIIDHGCKTCGSVPYGFPDDNNVDNGELTFNYAAPDPGKCQSEGLCPQ